VFGQQPAAQRARLVINRVAYQQPWTSESAAAIRHMRQRLEETASPRNLKRGRGGTVDTEFLVQMLQLKHGESDPSIRIPGTLDALRALEQSGHLAASDASFLRESYRFQRAVEARIRLMNASGRHELPSDPREMARLAFLLGYSDAAQLESEAQTMFQRTRKVFEDYFAREESMAETSR
jgi:glutamate-ammonia-ligase adenylyltransferase